VSWNTFINGYTVPFYLLSTEIKGEQSERDAISDAQPMYEVHQTAVNFRLFKAILAAAFMTGCILSVDVFGAPAYLLVQ